MICYEQEQENGLQDAHNPRFIVYPFGHHHRISDLFISASYESKDCQPASPVERPADVFYRDLPNEGICFCCPPQGVCFFAGQKHTPHQIWGVPATAAVEIGVTVAPKVSVAAASAIASNVFMFPLLECSTFP
jgi:hypothetical protein